MKPAAPEPPAWLDSEAEAEWRRVVPELDAQGIVSGVDRAILASYVTAWSVLVRAVGELDAAEALTTDGSKSRIRAPELMAWRDAVATLAMLASKIMASPAGRLRMRVPDTAASTDPLGILD